MKNIVILHQYFNFPSESGSTRTYHLAQILRSQGWRVFVVSGILDQGTDKKTGVFKKDGLIVIRHPVISSNKDKFYKRILSFFVFCFMAFSTLIRIKAKIVFVSSTPLTVAIPALLYRLLTSSRYIIEVRDVWPEVPVALGVLKNRFLIKFAQLLEYLAYNYATAIVALSAGMSDSIIKTCSKAVPIVVPNGINAQTEMTSERYTPEMPKPISDIINSGSPFMCYTGTFGHVNDMVFLTKLMIAYCAQNDEIYFILLGCGKEFEKCRSIVNSAGLSGRIVILPQSDKELAFFVTKKAVCSFCFVRPIQELFNNSANKLPESLWLGTPVILNYRGWQSELLEKHNLSFVVDSREISQACSELASIHRDLLTREPMTSVSNVGMKCHRLACEAFDLNTTFQPVIEELEKMHDEI